MEKLIPRRRSLGFLSLLILMLSGIASADQLPATTRAISLDPLISKPAIAVLRSMGPVGLQLMLDAYAKPIAAHRAGLTAASDPDWHAISSAITAVSAQYDGWSSGLYWYTELPSAQAAAKASGKPILYLRLLGKLDEDKSCANSRFFRTVLYANADVSAYLREHFVLYWESERPAPVITVDFGDGRKIETTITGNSIHYILTPTGDPIDAIPGLYGPAAFLRQLKQAETAEANFVSAADPASAAQSLKEYHRRQSAALKTNWNADMKKLGYTPITEVESEPVQQMTVSRALSPTGATDSVHPPISAQDAPLVRQLAPDLSEASTVSDTVWLNLAQLHAGDAKLDRGSTTLMRFKQPNAAAAAALAMTKSVVENPLVRIIANFQQSIAQDTVRNEYTLHAKIHDWFANGLAPTDLAQLNNKVYSELFLTPRSDPWLGLVTPDTYTGLDANNVCEK